MPAAISVSSLAGLFALLTGWWAIEGHWQTKAEAEVHEKKDDQKGAWLSYGIADLKSTILSNRLNDCKLKTKLTPMEASVCLQYQTDANTASDKARDMYKSAITSGK